MICRKEREFRMIADAVGSRVVDLGSNQQEFWYHISKAEPPYLFYCSYKDLAQGVQMPFPFQPEWVMEAMGMGNYGSPEQYTLASPSQRGTWELVQQTVNSQGQPVRKVTVFNQATS